LTIAEVYDHAYVRALRGGQGDGSQGRSAEVDTHGVKAFLVRWSLLGVFFVAQVLAAHATAPKPPGPPTVQLGPAAVKILQQHSCARACESERVRQSDSVPT
jgi:hypothetical protein